MFIKWVLAMKVYNKNWYKSARSCVCHPVLPNIAYNTCSKVTSSLGSVVPICMYVCMYTYVLACFKSSLHMFKPCSAEKRFAYFCARVLPDTTPLQYVKTPQQCPLCLPSPYFLHVRISMLCTTIHTTYIMLFTPYSHIGTKQRVRWHVSGIQHCCNSAQMLLGSARN